MDSASAAGSTRLNGNFPEARSSRARNPARALARELREELAIVAEIGKELDRYDVRYGDGPLTRLIFYRVTKFDGEPQNLAFEQIAWDRPERLPDYDFLAGDIEFLKKLLKSPKMAQLGNHE